jgi:outer membrane autotransporter protein
MIHSRLLAWSPPPDAGLLSDVGGSLLGGVDMKDAKMMVSPETANSWNVFVSGNVVLAQDFSDPSAGTAHADAATEGVQIGADYRIDSHFLVGAMFGYGHTDATLDTLNSTASVDTYSPGVYASYSGGGWYANALGSYGFADYDQDRKVAIGAFNGTAQSSPSGDQIVGDLDGGYDFHQGHWIFGPTLGAQYVHLDVDGFTESGLPGANMTVNQDESDSLRSRLGGRVSYDIQDGAMRFTPHLSAGWQHEFLDQSRGVTSQFDGVGAGSFVVRTGNPSRDSVLVDIGFDAQIDKTWTVFTDYTVQAGQDNYFGQSVQAGVKIGF